MNRALAALLLALLLAPAASAQFVSRPAIGVSEGMVIDRPAILVELRLETDEDPKTRAPPVEPWLVVGHDNLLNLTVTNNRDAPLNATFRVNATGATVFPTEISLQIEPYGVAGQVVTVHAEDTGVVELHAEAIDAFQPDGRPLEANARMPALLLPSLRWIDPPLQESDPESEFVAVSAYYGHRGGSEAYLRIRPGEAIVPRVELSNPFETTLAGFRLRLQMPGSSTSVVEISPMEPGSTRLVEFSEYRPVERGFGPSFGGPQGSFQLRPLMDVTVGGAELSAGALSFRVERGAIVDVLPALAIVEVQDGLAVDLFVPRAPVLGVPARVAYNLTNMQTTPIQGPLTITLQTPHRLSYEVQGPQSFQVQVDLQPGERRSGTIEFTPRVTGTWLASTLFRSPMGFGFGGGGGFDVRGPVVIGFETQEQVFARIGEPVVVDVALATTDTLQDARLRIGTGSNLYRDPTIGSGADHRAGFLNGLVESRTASADLGTLRPGGVVNTSIELSARSSGTYTIVPYVLAEGFAYTSTTQLDPETQRPVDVGIGSSMPQLSLAVYARELPAGLSLAPFTLGLAFFVGAWTLRTRFVK